jgi:hypothetical protein
MLYYLCRVAMSYAVAVVCRPPSIADGRGRDGGGRSRRTECGQTNWIKFIPFVCPSQSMLHHQHRRHPLPSSNHGDRQTNWIKFIPFVCPSQSMLPTRDQRPVDIIPPHGSWSWWPHSALSSQNNYHYQCAVCFVVTDEDLI